MRACVGVCVCVHARVCACVCACVSYCVTYIRILQCFLSYIYCFIKILYLAICISLERKSRVRKKPRLQSPSSPLNSKASFDNRKVRKDYVHEKS